MLLMMSSICAGPLWKGAHCHILHASRSGLPAVHASRGLQGSCVVVDRRQGEPPLSRITSSNKGISRQDRVQLECDGAYINLLELLCMREDQLVRASAVKQAKTRSKVAAIKTEFGSGTAILMWSCLPNAEGEDTCHVFYVALTIKEEPCTLIESLTIDRAVRYKCD